MLFNLSSFSSFLIAETIPCMSSSPYGDGHDPMSCWFRLQEVSVIEATTCFHFRPWNFLARFYSLFNGIWHYCLGCLESDEHQCLKILKDTLNTIGFHRSVTFKYHVNQYNLLLIPSRTFSHGMGVCRSSTTSFMWRWVQLLVSGS